MPSELFYQDSSDRLISNTEDVCLIFIIDIPVCPDQTLRSVASDLRLHCFAMYTWGKKKRKFKFLNTESLWTNWSSFLYLVTLVYFPVYGSHKITEAWT